jgi:molybdopterin converting factor small subunit
MIRVKLLGHIKTSLGKEEIVIEKEKIDTVELIEFLRVCSGETNPGFNQYNTLVVVEGGEAFPSSSKREINSGQSIVLVPFSHGG